MESFQSNESHRITDPQLRGAPSARGKSAPARMTSDKNIDFNDLTRLLDSFNFSCRIKGDHHIYYKEDVEEIINIQPLSNNKAKPYQVKQIRLLILKYKFNWIKNE